MRSSSIVVAGAGIIGLWQALTLARAGHRVQLVEKSAAPFANAASHWAGAMIAPECEAEGAPPVVRDLGRRGLALWSSVYPGTIVNGTLVVAHGRDAADLARFARMTEAHESIDAARLAALEPGLAGRFDRGLFFPGEAHFDAGKALAWLMAEAKRCGVELRLGEAWRDEGGELTIDCRGMAARADIQALRGVRGERVLIEAPGVNFTRPIRLLHPRQPIYVVPQGDGRFVVGASVIEREDDGPMTLKSALDLLGSAYTLDPAFGEAAILDLGAGVRPAFPDNVPRILIEAEERVIRVNGAYRHGFLLAPVLAEAVAAYLSDGRREGPLFRRP